MVSEKMPEDNPGSLTPVESAEVVAYLLKSNGKSRWHDGAFERCRRN